MLKRSLIYAVLIVCVFSFFSIHNISYAGTGLSTWDTAEQLMLNAKEIVTEERDQYHIIQDDIKSLIGEWDDTEIANANQRFLAVVAVAGAIISVASKGSLYPAAYVISVTGAKTTYNEGKYSIDKRIYMLSMGALVPLMDRARSNIDAAYDGGYLDVKPPGISMGQVSNLKYTPGYVPEYDAYLTMAVQHLNGYAYYIGKYSNKVTLTFEALESAVKDSFADGTSGYYHRGVHDGDKGSKEDHVFDKFKTFANFGVRADLPSKYKCYGKYSVCGAIFRTPYEAFTSHRVKCGSAELSLYHEAMKRLNGIAPEFSDPFLYEYESIRKERQKNPSLGCGFYYYSCKDADKHGLSYAKGCRCPYRKCLGLVHVCNDDEDSEGQQNVSPSPGLSPVSGSSNPSVRPGGTHKAKLVTSKPYYYVRWYIKGPGGTSSLGTLVQTDEGWSTGTETEANLSYTFSASAVLGEYTITAVSQRYSDLSQGSTRSYTVTVE